MDKNWKNNLLENLNLYMKQLSSLISRCQDKTLFTQIEAASKEEKKVSGETKRKVNLLIKTLETAAESVDDEVKELLEYKIKSLKKDLVDNDDYNILPYIKNNQIDLIINDYVSLRLGSNLLSHYETYSPLITFLVFAGLMPQATFDGIIYAHKVCQPGDDYSKVCFDLYEKVFSNYLFESKDKNLDGYVFKGIKVYDGSVIPFEAHKGKNSSRIVVEREKNYHFLNVNFVKKLISYLKEKEYTSIMDFVISFRKEMKFDVKPDLLEMKKLYELTDSQILIYDQRYYSEKSIEEKNRQAELDRELQREIEEQRRQEHEEMMELEEERMRREEAQRAQDEFDREMAEIEQERLISESNRIAAQNARDEERRHKEQMAAQKRQSEAIIDAQLASLKAELFNLHGPNDSRRRIAVESQIRDLESKKRNL